MGRAQPRRCTSRTTPHARAGQPRPGRSPPRSTADLLLPQQVHGAAVLVVDASRACRRGLPPPARPRPTHWSPREPTAPLGVLVADCLPVLIADPATGSWAQRTPGAEAWRRGAPERRSPRWCRRARRPATASRSSGPASAGAVMRCRSACATRSPPSCPAARATTTSRHARAGPRCRCRAHPRDAGIGAVRLDRDLHDRGPALLLLPSGWADRPVRRRRHAGRPMTETALRRAAPRSRPTWPTSRLEVDAACVALGRDRARGHRDRGHQDLSGRRRRVALPTSG